MGKWVLIVAAAGFFAAQRASFRLYTSHYPNVEELVLREDAVRDFASVMMGMRRLGADLAYVQMLQYYGEEEELDPHQNRAYAFDQLHHQGGGHYPRLYECFLRIQRLDPYFRSSTLYGSGALAFNLERPDEAIALLTEAVKRDPKFWRYALYIGAIGYKKAQQPERMIPLLEQAVQYADCPAQVKNILGNLYKKLKAWDKAIAVFANMAETTRDPADKSTAERQIREILQESQKHP